MGIFLYLLCDFAVMLILLIFCVEFNYLLGKLYLPHMVNGVTFVNCTFCTEMGSGTELVFHAEFARKSLR